MCYSRLKWRKFEPSEDFLQFAIELNSVAKLTHYIKQNFKYVGDKSGLFGDYWKTPEEMWKDGYGDCEDHAIFCLYILTKVMGIEANMVMYSGYFLKDGKTEFNGHAVCVFEYDGKWGVFTNNDFYCQEGSIEDIGRKWYPKGLKYMEVINNEGQTVKMKLPKYLFWGTFQIGGGNDD